MFQKGDKVKLKAVIPSGEIIRMRMDEDGTIWYLMSWGAEGAQQERWFTGDQLESAG